MTGIQWTEAVWNPTTGCDRVSPGCDHCYALTMAKRLKGMGQAKYQNDGDPRTSGPGFGLAVHADTLDVPLRWRKPRKVFVNSMSDLFHARVPVSFISQVFAVMARTPQHTYQVLTKRPNRMLAILGDDFDAGYRLLEEAVSEADAEVLYERWPLPNVWLGASIELDDAKYVGRAENLRGTSAAVRFLSLEPLLGPLPSLSFEGIDWAIIGGESGKGARPLDVGWVRDLIARGHDAGTAMFVKQLGTRWARTWQSKDDHGGDWDIWPTDLRVRDFPQPVTASAG